jgi:hypothetical protein
VLLTAGALAILVMVALGSIGARQPGAAVIPPPPVELPDTLSFPVGYAGMGAEGVDMIWRGRLSSPAAGLVTIRMEYAGAAVDRRMPIWPVSVWLFFSADDYRSSFAAELSGSMNWNTGEMRVTGLVSDGNRIDSPLEQRMRIRQPELAGTTTVLFLSRVALRPGFLLAGSAD